MEVSWFVFSAKTGNFHLLFPFSFFLDSQCHSSCRENSGMDHQPTPTCKNKKSLYVSFLANWYRRFHEETNQCNLEKGFFGLSWHKNGSRTVHWKVLWGNQNCCMAPLLNPPFRNLYFGVFSIQFLNDHTVSFSGHIDKLYCYHPGLLGPMPQVCNAGRPEDGANEK